MNAAHPTPGTGIGLLVSNPVDARLLEGFFSELGYGLRTATDADAGIDELQGSGMIIVDESSGYRHRAALMKMKHDAEPLFVPVLVLINQKSDSAWWIKQGFDDVLRIPMVKAELLVRLETFGRLRAASHRAQRENELRFRTTFDQAPIGIAHVTADGRLLLANQTLCSMLGYTEEELLALRSADITFPEDIERTARHRVGLMGRKPQARAVLEKRYVRKDGTVMWAELTTAPVRDAQGEPRYLINLISDITERKQLERNLARVTQARQMMAECNRVLIHATTEAQLLDDMCKVAVSDSGYRMAWIGMPGEGAERRVFPVAQAGDDGWLRTLEISASADAPFSTGPMGTAIRTGNTCVIADMHTDPNLASWREQTIQRGLVSAIAVPLISEGRCLGGFCIYSRERDAFGTEETALLRELADDIAFGMTALRTRDARRQAEADLRESERFAHATIDALALNICVLDETGNIIATNKAWREFASQIGGKTLKAGAADQNYLAVCDRATGNNAAESAIVAQAIRDIIAGRSEEFSLEYPCHSASEERWFVAKVNRFADDGPIRVVVSHQNITDRKKAENEVRESEARYRAVVDLSPDPIFIHQDWKFVFANAATARLFRIESNTHLIGRPVLDFVDPEDRAIARGRTARVYDERTTLPLREMKMIAADGSNLYLESHTSPFVWQGRAAAQVIARDVTLRKHAEQQLYDSEVKYRSLIEQASDGIFVINAAGRILLVNSPACELLGYSEGELLGAVHSVTYLDGENNEAEARIAQAKTGAVLRYERSVRRKDGSTFPAEFSSRMLDNGTIQVIFRNISERRMHEERIARLSRIHAVLSGINSAIVRIRDRRELFQEACRIIVEHGRFTLGWIARLDPGTGKLMAVAQEGLPAIRVAADDFFNGSIGLVPAGAAVIALAEKRPAVDKFIEESSPTLGVQQDTDSLKVRRAAIKLGAKSVIALPLIVEGRTFGVLTLYAAERDFFDEEEIKLLDNLAGDISFGLEFIAKEEKVDYLAYYDSLTGLPNRSLFFDRLTHQLGTAAREQANVALLLVDLDRFGQVNDTLGRRAGDRLLTAVSERLNSTIRDRDAVARVGPNRFALAISGMSDSTEVAHALESRKAKWFGQPFTIGGEELRISATVGIAIFPNDSTDADALFANAEAALRLAKSQNAGFLFYGPEMNARVAESLRIETRLRRAIANQELTLWYQPKIDLVTGKLTGLEALMRWRDPEHGLIPPGKFIPIMEQTGMILQAGNWALSQVAADCRQWRHGGVAAPRVAVNVSPIQLQQKDFVTRIVAAAEETAAAGGALDLEITESVIMENVDAIIPKLQTVRGLGVEIYIDDFGTGYSSLAYIARLPIHSLKIDRSFIVGMTQSQESLNIVNSVISLAHSLKLRVVAEGVETEAQSALLGQIACDEIQGFFLSRPLPPEEIPALISRLT